MEKVLNQLATLDLGGASRQVLGERNNLVNRDSPPAAAPKDGKGAKDTGGKDAGAKGAGAANKKPEVIELSSDDSADENAHARSRTLRGRTTKAARLAQVARAVAGATENRALAAAVRELAAAMQESRSKTLTKEGFAVLDALHKQLADPSVFVAPARSSRPRASGASEGQEGSGRETRQGKMNKLFRLGVDARAAGSNEQLARLVSEFGQVIFRSTGRTVTKDGLAFLNVVAARLEVLS